MCTFFANGAKVVQPDIKHSEDWLHAIPYFWEFFFYQNVGLRLIIVSGLIFKIKGHQLLNHWLKGRI